MKSKFTNYLIGLGILLLIPLLSECGLSGKKSAEDIAISKAKELYIATANGDVDKLKELTTAEFYQESYPGSDELVREQLLSFSEKRRKNMIDQIQHHTSASAFMNSAGDVITVNLVNEENHKERTIQLVDESGTGDWRINLMW